MGTYVLRIYRYGEDRSRQIFGLLEFPENDTKEVFTSMDELWLILSCHRGEDDGISRVIRRRRVIEVGKTDNEIGY
jgi:hypothetical protein